MYVGDAGAKALLFVNTNGDVNLLKALPAEPITIAAPEVAVAAEAGLMVPDCMMGLTYYAQPVPTDVELKVQWLYYTLLPGVPGESLDVGKDHRVNVQSGTTQLLANNLAAPTSIAVARNNNVCVTQLFGDGVSHIKNGTVSNVFPAMMASDVEVSGNTMAMLTNALADTGGSLITRGIR